jgi:hypothetical protein
MPAIFFQISVISVISGQIYLGGSRFRRYRAIPAMSYRRSTVAPYVFLPKLS